MRGILFHDDNTRLHKACRTLHFLQKYRVQLAIHSLYSPDLALNDFFLFPKNKKSLCGKSIQTQFDGWTSSLFQEFSKTQLTRCFSHSLKQWRNILRLWENTLEGNRYFHVVAKNFQNNPRICGSKLLGPFPTSNLSVHLLVKLQDFLFNFFSQYP